MKKLILPLVWLAIFLAPYKSNAQSLEAGKIIVDGYYGFGNLYNAIFESLASSSGLNITNRFVGPIGVRGEYLISEKVGFGLDLGYSSASMNYNETITSYNYDNNGVPTMATTDTYNYSVKSSKIGAMVTFNYHFVESDKFDAYFVTGLGYGNRTTTYASTYVDYIVPSSTSSLFPVAARIGFGMRYFFTENIGANLGLGLGQGGLLNVGITAKF